MLLNWPFVFHLPRLHRHVRASLFNSNIHYQIHETCLYYTHKVWKCGIYICIYLHIQPFNQVHSMEQCLEAVELVQLIALNVCGVHNLLCLALVCTRTAGPALEELWKRNNNFEKLLHCLPISGDKLIVSSISSWCKLNLYSNIL